jgi:hypothetical protein
MTALSALTELCNNEDWNKPTVKKGKSRSSRELLIEVESGWSFWERYISNSSYNLF